MIELDSLYAFLLIFVRLTAFFVSAPIFSSRSISIHYKIGFNFFLVIILFPFITIETQGLTDNNGLFILLLLQETIIGLVLGWIAQMIFASIQVAGAFIDIQNGLGMANVTDAQTGNQIPLLGNFKYAIAVLLFFSLDIHHLLIDSIISSYNILPIGANWIVQLNSEPVLIFILTTFLKMFLLAFKIAAPIVVTLLISDITLGIIARTVPQLNVFVIGLPLKVLLNYIIMFFIVAGFIYMYNEVFKEMLIAMKNLMNLMGL